MTTTTPRNAHASGAAPSASTAADQHDPTAGSSPTSDDGGPSLLRQPRAVWAVAFAAVVAFMGIGLVDPILPAIASDLDATHAQVMLLFTSYMAVTGVAMLVTGWVSSRIGAKKTLLAGLAIIVVFAALAGASDSIGAIVGLRAGWGLGNALFIATALATIVGAASGGVASAIILYEAALGVGIATGPLLGGLLGSVSWRGPFFGTAVLMAIAFVAITVLLPRSAPPERRTSLADPFRALRFPALRALAVTAFFYNMGFFALLAYTPLVLDMSAGSLGLIFFGWGVCLAVTSVLVAPCLHRRFGRIGVILAMFVGLGVVLAVMALTTTAPAALIVCVILAGAFLGVVNTLLTEAVMVAAPVERAVASAAYSFVRFFGGALAPFLAGFLAEVSVGLPFWMGAAAVVVAFVVLLTQRRTLGHADRDDEPEIAEAEALTVAEAS
ncbi:major facilitator superfamily MFS_1 [Beutenbergia cavernae DSM 12333]|uniref:Major facilitator superfamily MFS_1 n=1 Tax=Beutenbergia cavernae (strain ATCC BAA-8 / DSM 12333 / CCUG 43141 / JCM 11478 / NBRC 16432 / NCIMB 13614 / HKI 0122) TaxID=471853 RepID=C5BWK7_BEUC1|nr:MFS transporter [Beutenbergia cavernae]ACQ78665.1 major facilitator superfamily MFS_1 [Beutenbergia cavernae DSM 12333]